MAEPLFEDEKVVEYPSIAEGDYTAVFSKMKKNEKTEGGIILEFILMRRAMPKSDGVVDLVKIIPGTVPMQIELKKLANGNYFTLGMVQRVMFNPIKPEAADYLKSFFGRQRKLTAVAFDAYDHEAKTVKWGKINQSVSKVVTFALVRSKKDTRYMNVDLDSLFVLPTQQVDVKSIDAIYKILDEQRAARDNKDVEFPPKVDDVGF